MKNLYAAILKKIIDFSFLAGLLISTQNFAQPLDFNSAYVEKTSTTVASGVEITKIEKIYIDQYGNREAHYITEKQNISMANMVTEEETVSITDGEWIINYNPKTKEGTKMKLGSARQFQGMSEEDMKKMAQQMGETTNTETNDIGTKEIAGKTCKGTEATTNMMGMKTKSTTWQYGNFVMEMNGEGSGTKFTEKVTKFDEGIKVDPTVFIVPIDVDLKVVKSPY